MTGQVAGAEEVEDQQRAENAAEEELQHGVQVLRSAERHAPSDGHEDGRRAGQIREQDEEVDGLDRLAEGQRVPGEAGHEEHRRYPGADALVCVQDSLPDGHALRRIRETFSSLPALPQ